MNPDLQFKLNLYQNSPDVFNDDELDLLKGQLESAGVDKSVIDGVQHAGPERNSGFSLARTIGNFLEGTVEGATTLSAGVTDPQNTTETIARSLGSLAGFVGVFPIGGGVLATGLKAGSKALRGAKILEKSTKAKRLADFGEKAARSVSKATDDKNFVPIFSVPKQLSKFFMESVGNTNRAQELIKSYKWLQKGTKSEAIIHEAINLGLMSGISTLTINPGNWKETSDNFMGSLISGTAMGATFGGIGNFVKVKRALQSPNPMIRKHGERVVKAITGSIAQGMFMHAHAPDDVDIPMAEQIYEYLLGAYFGANTATAKQRAVAGNRDLITKAREKDVPISELAKDRNLNKDVVTELEKINTNIDIKPNIMRSVLQDFGKPLEYNPQDFYDVSVIGGTHKGKTGKIITVNEKTGWAKLDLGNNKKNGTDIPVKNLEYKETTESEYRPGESFIEDHTTAVSDVMELIEINRPTNTYINKNLENASYEIQRQLRDTGAPLDRLSIQRKIKEAVAGKSDYNWNSIIEALNEKFSDVGQLNVSEGNKLNNLGRYLRRFSKSEQNKQSVDMVHLNLDNSGIAIEPYGHLNAKGQVVANKRRHIAKWVGVRREAEIQNESQGGVTKIISGMQSGVDMAGLRAGEKLGIETGGTAPPKNITKEVSGEANRKALADRYKVVEGEADSSIYPKRTMKNIDDANATIAIRTKQSPGTDKTIGYAQTGKWQTGNSKEGVYEGHKPLLVLNSAGASQKNIKAIREFASKYPGTINIAGHSSKSLGKVAQKLFEKALDPNVTKQEWSRYPEGRNNYEVSSVGDKRFSAFYAQLKDGRYIEDIYQLNIKGHGTAQPKPISDKLVKTTQKKMGAFKRKVSREQSWEEYKDLWKQYLKENSDLLKELRIKSQGKVLTDKFANTDVSQARALAEILNKDVKQPSTTKIKRGTFSYNEIATREGIIETDSGSKGIVSKIFREKDLANSEWSKKKLKKDEINARHKHVRKTKDLYEDGKFVLGGSGEKDTIIFTDLQFPRRPRSNNVNAPRNYIRQATRGHNEIIKSLNEQRINFKKLYNLTKSSQIKGQRELGRDYNNLDYAYQNMVASKVMWIENLNQKSFKEILDANKKWKNLPSSIKKKTPKPYIDNAIDLNKRFPVMHASEPAWDRTVYEGLKDVENGNFKIVLVNALNKNSKAKYEKIVSKALGKELDAHRDGIYVLRRDIFDAAIDDAGLPKNVASAKGTLLTTNGNKGLMLGKYAYVRATEALNASFKKDGIHGELYDTSIKQIGERELYDVSLKKGQSVYTDNKGKEVAPSIVAEEIPIIDHRMNLGVYENPMRNLKNAVSALQRWEWTFSPYLQKAGVSQKEIKDFFRELTNENFEGKESINELLRKDNKITEEELAKVREVDIDDMSVELVMKIASSHKDTPLYRTVWDKLHRRLNEVQELASGNDFVDTEALDFMNDILNIRSMSDNILKMSPDITPLINNHKWVRKYSDMVLKNYLLNRVNKPKEKYSSKHIFLPYDRYMQTNKLTAGLKPGEIIMYKDAAQAKVELNGKEMTLEKALKIDPNLEQVLLRVPADNISGQRVVKVKLVLNEKGTGIVVHPEDMHFMGGADLDIDSGFMYRSTPKKFRDAIKNSRYEMKDVDPTGPESVKQFSKGDIAGVSTEKILSDPAYMLDPFISEQVGHNSRINNNNLGIAVSTGQGYGRMMDYVLSNPGKNYKLNAKNLPKELLELIETFIEPVLEIKSTGNVKEYMKEVQKAVNMYADAGKFGSLISGKDLKAKLFMDTNVVVSIKDAKTGNKIDLSTEMSQKIIDEHSVFGAAQGFKTSLNGVYYEDGVRRQMTIDEITKSAKDYIRELEANEIDPNTMPGVLTVKAQKLLNHESNNNFVGNINTEKLDKLYAETVARAEKDNLIASYNRGKGGIEGQKHRSIEEFKDFVSNDIDFIATVRKLEGTYKKAREQMSKEEFETMKNEVLDAATELRVQWQIEKYWNKNQKLLANKGPIKLADAVNKSISLKATEFRAESPVKEQLFYDLLTSNVITNVNQRADILRKNMIKKIQDSNAVRGKGAGENIGKFLDTFLQDKYSILSKNPDKAVPVNLDLMYSVDSIPVKYLKNHFKIRQQIEESLQGYSAPVLEIQNQRKQQIREKLRSYNEGKAKQELIDKVNEQVADNAELMEMRSDLEAIFHREPDLVAKIEQAFPEMSNRPYATSLIDSAYGRSLKDATAGDIQNFINYFKSRMTAKEWVELKEGSDRYKKLYKAAYWTFPETVANKVGPFDLNFVQVDGPRKVWENGKLVEKTDLLVPMSGFERLTTDNKLADQISTGLTDQINNKFLRGKFDWLQSIKETGDQGSLKNSAIQRLAVEAAVGIHESPLRNTHKTYIDGYNQSLKILNKIGKEKYSVTIGKETKAMTGEAIVQKIAKDISDTMVFVDKNFLHSGRTFSDFLIRNNTGEASIGKTIREKIQPVLRETSKLESLKPGQEQINKEISNDNLFKFLELWKRNEQVIDWNGQTILRRDLKEIDFPAYKKWQDKQIADIQANHGVGRIADKDGNSIGYFPHRGIPKKIIDEYIESKAGDKGGLNANIERYLNEEIVMGALGRADGGAMQSYNNIILHHGDRSPSRLNIRDKTAQTPSPHQRRRSANLPKYEKNISVLSKYMSQIIKARYNALMALSNAETIRGFETRTYKDGTPVMGSETNRNHWGKFMRMNSLKAVGGQHILPEQWLKDKSFSMSKLYTSFTEGQLHKRLKSMGKIFNNEDMFLPKDRNGKTSPEALSDRLNWLSNLEARVSTSTLLFNTRGWVYNMFGGNANSLITAGLHPMAKAYDYNYLRSIIPDPAMKKGEVDNRGKDWFLNWAKEHGVIETFWTSELSANNSFRAIKGMKGYDSFVSELRMAAGLKKDTRTDKRDVMEVLKKYQIDQKASDLGGFFMKHAEQELRLRSFLAHYVKARDVFAARGVTFTADDPALIKIALEGTVGSQYLYNNVSRPLATATPAGRIMSRFQLWAGNSLRLRKDVFKMAKDVGFEKGTEEYKKYERMLGADMMMFAMASMLPYSMFDATLPPPYNYYTEFSQMLYGSPQEKERAFFGTLPYPLNVTGLITPPSARYITQPLGNLMSGDWERFWDYQIYTWFPYGMVMKTGNDIIKSPIKAVDKISGFPLYRLNYMSKENEEKKAA